MEELKKITLAVQLWLVTHGPGDLLEVIDTNCFRTVIASFFCK